MREGKRGRLWPWGVAAVVAVVLVVWLAVTLVDRRGAVPADPAGASGGVAAPADTVPGSGRPADGTRGEPVTGAAAEELVRRTEEMRAAVRRYEQGCAARLEPVVGEGLGSLVADCIQRLAAAVDAIVASDTVGEVAIEERLGAYREQVERLERTPPGEGRADPTRAVLSSVTEVLAVIREERYPESLAGEGTVDGAMEELRSAVQSVDRDRPLDRQRHTLRRYFTAAGGVLSAMARPGDPGPGPEMTRH